MTATPVARLGAGAESDRFCRAFVIIFRAVLMARGIYSGHMVGGPGHCDPS